MTNAYWDVVRHVGVVEEDGVLTVGIADRPSGDGPALLFMVSRDAADERDRGLGHDTYCVVDEKQTTVYGGVASLRLERSTLKLGFSIHAQQALGLPSRELTFRLDLLDAQGRSLLEGLLTLFSLAPERDRPIIEAPGV